MTQMEHHCTTSDILGGLNGCTRRDGREWVSTKEVEGEWSEKKLMEEREMEV